jgi:hypothetical protein
MIRATIFLAMGCLLASATPRVVFGLAWFAQTAPAQPPSQATAPPGAAAPASSEGGAPKPCPAVSPSQSAPQPECKPADKGEKTKGSPPAAPGSGPHKRVVYNGDTAEPPVAISPGLSPQQASQQSGRTTWLLEKTDDNLKILAVRRLNAAQQDTLSQIKRYVEESKAATKAGDLQRAYTLANKARMLSGDLVKH